MPEACSSQADAILEDATTVWVSDLAVTEFHIAVTRRVKLGTLSLEHSSVVRAAFEEHLEEDILRRVKLKSAHYDAASRLAEKSSAILRTLDALHLAVVEELGFTVATFDQRMAEAARSLGFEALP